MKPHPRIRKTVKWGGAPITFVVLVLLVVLDGWVWTNKAGWWTRLDFFTLEVGHAVPVPPEFDPAFAWGPDKHAKSIWFGYGRPQPQLSIALGWIPLLSGALAAFAWWLDRRSIRRDRYAAFICPRCCYDRSGLAASAVCPECGAAPASVNP